MNPYLQVIKVVLRVNLLVNFGANVETNDTHAEHISIVLQEKPASEVGCVERH